MGLLANGFRQTQTGRILGATNVDGANPYTQEYRGHMTARMRNMLAGQGITDSKASVPSGARQPVAWIIARKNGAMASRNDSVMTFTPTANGAMGLPAIGSGSFAITIAPASGELISSGTGSASFAVTATGNVLASLSGVGSALMTFATNNPQMTAQGWAAASGTFSVTGNLTSYGVGFMSGSTIDTTTLTADQILAAMNANPPAVNIKKVNDYNVTGNGQSGTEWGPA